MILAELIGKINTKRLATRALDMLRIPSPTGQTRVVAEYFSEACRSLGGAVTVIDEIPDAPAEYDAPSVAALWQFGDGPTLQIDGHTDTIDMPHSPAELRDGFLTGRGAVDMKASVAAAIEAVNVISDTG
ncbi:MAG TPA: M20/M25/M40 family metallo-hydrolase, partial [Firmicutes bacterium]|nr:M20/M25/M40 family metallo-hydrolase [Bacillota bacterium]